MSRVLFTSIGAALLATMLSMPAQAQQRPQIETTKVDGTDNVYIFRNGNHQSMFVVTKDGVIATDPIAYGRPNGGQQYVDEIKKVTDKPIKYLIYSHHHYDHIGDLADVVLTGWLQGRRRPLRVVGPPGTESIVTALVDRVFDRDIAFRSQGEHAIPWAPVGSTESIRAQCAVADCALYLASTTH